MERKIMIITDREGKGYECPIHSPMKCHVLPIMVFEEVCITKGDVNRWSVEKQVLGKKQSEKV